MTAEIPTEPRPRRMGRNTAVFPKANRIEGVVSLSAAAGLWAPEAPRFELPADPWKEVTYHGEA